MLGRNDAGDDGACGDPVDLGAGVGVGGGVRCGVLRTWRVCGVTGRWRDDFEFGVDAVLGRGAGDDGAAEFFGGSVEVFADDPADASVALSVADDAGLIEAHVEICVDEQVGRDIRREIQRGFEAVGGDFDADETLEAGVRGMFLRCRHDARLLGPRTRTDRVRAVVRCSHPLIGLDLVRMH